MRYDYADVVRHDILRLVPSDGKIIGSIGCGNARTEQELMTDREVHGADVDAPSIEIASKRLTSAKVISPDEEFPFDESSLDGLILADVIEHLPLAWERLEKWSRAVKPGGWVLVSVPNMRNLQVVRRFFIGGDWPEQSAGIFDRTHLQVMSRRRLSRWLQNARLDPEKWEITYVSSGKPIQKLLIGFDRLTFGFWREWFALQWQVLCRKR